VDNVAGAPVASQANLPNADAGNENDVVKVTDVNK
jgi:hypothetical protein